MNGFHFSTNNRPAGLEPDSDSLLISRDIAILGYIVLYVQTTNVCVTHLLE